LEFSVLPHLHKNNLLSSGGWLNKLVSCRDRDRHRLLSVCVVYVCQNLQADFFAKQMSQCQASGTVCKQKMLLKRETIRVPKNFVKKPSILPPENAVQILSENYFKMHRQRRHRQ
jgi:hypothetical protein